LKLVSESGKNITVRLPDYQMPRTKNASGYYIEDNMDAIDLFIGSDGSLGIISRLELELLPWPNTIWGIMCFLTEERQALEMVIAARGQLDRIASIEFFDSGALQIFNNQDKVSTGIRSLPEVSSEFAAAIYFELHCDNDDQAIYRLSELCRLMEQSGGCADNSWVARTNSELNLLLNLRHAIPEAVNQIIDRRKKIYPSITKLGTDMSVPDNELCAIMEIYHSMLTERGFESAIWGHIGNNHVHVNILPRDDADYARAKELYSEWANIVTAKGGAVSAEHGIGKLKSPFLEIMYGKENVSAMAAVKAALDDRVILGAGNLFDPKLVQEHLESGRA
jgi:D-lactate dehydrogenase (cytochrome)